MTKRTLVTILLLALIYPIDEVWQYWKDDTYTVSPWIINQIKFFKPMVYDLPVYWFVKMLCGTITGIITATIIFRCSRNNQIFRIASTVYLAMKCIDLIMFLWNCNTSNYILIYASSGIIIVIVSLIKHQSHTKQRQLQES